MALRKRGDVIAKKATTIAIVNQKGGTAKTTTCENLGIGLAMEGKKVLLVDVDPQGSLTISMGWQQPDELSTTLSTLMQKAMNDQPIQPGDGILHHAEGVDLIPANIEYCKGRVRSRQQFTAERADERSTNSMNITYTRNGDYLIPNIIIRKTKPLGHYGRLRKAYLEMHRPILFNELVLSDKLFEHCAEIDEAARNRMELIVRSLAEQNGVTEQLKAENQMEWVRQMNACKAQAEEIVKAELIYD